MGARSGSFPEPPPTHLLQQHLRQLASTLRGGSGQQQATIELAEAITSLEPSQARKRTISHTMHLYGLTGGNAPSWATQRILWTLQDLCGLHWRG